MSYLRAHPSYDWSDPATIAANRSGELTAQQRLLVGRPLNWGCLTLGSLLVVATCTAPALVAIRNSDPSGILFVAAPLLVMLLLFTINRRSARDRREAANGHLAQASGQVVWRGGRYVAELAGRRLRALHHYPLPAPGVYQFYYLPRSGLLVSAEPLHGEASSIPGLLSAQVSGFREVLRSPVSAGTPAATPSSDERGELARLAQVEALARTLHFSPRDLTANRSGRLSAAQRRRLVFDVVETLLGTFGAAAWLAVLALGTFAAVAYYQGPRLFPTQVDALRRQVEQQGIPLPLLLGGVATLIAMLCIIGGLAAFLAARPALRDWRAGQVATVDGIVQPESDTSGETTSYYYVVGRLRFEVPYRAIGALVEGQAFRLYYLPRTHALLSMEPLPDV